MCQSSHESQKSSKTTRQNRQRLDGKEFRLQLATLTGNRGNRQTFFEPSGHSKGLERELGTDPKQHGSIQAELPRRRDGLNVHVLKALPRLLSVSVRIQGHVCVSSRLKFIQLSARSSVETLQTDILDTTRVQAWNIYLGH